jgi:GTP-binding protein
MDITNATFLLSSPDLKSCPESTLPEYAFIGRSNVGKSSLINMLTNIKELAKTSTKPGKTLLINFFLVNKKWHLVDLPGYGYAKASKTTKERIYHMINEYVVKRQQLSCLFVLIDSRHEPQAIDLDFIDFLGESEVPFALVFTKTDKISREKVAGTLNAYKKALSERWEELPPFFTTSAEKKQGREELLNYIDSINQSMAD